MRAAIGAAGARTLFLPPYGPTSTPSRWPSRSRKRCSAKPRSECRRAVDGLWPNIGRLVDSGTPIECANFFAGVGYEPDLTETALTTRLV